MKRSKFSFLAFNLIWELPVFFVICLLLPDFFTNITQTQATIIALWFYIHNVISESKFDDLKHQIDLKQDK